jgi:hypothetical protein
MATRTLTIDKEFAGLCPNLTDEESAHLEASIEADGCRDEIVVWANHKDTILDGHHRYKICKRLGKTFKTTALRFESREECIEWIIVNQLGRRNLTDEQKSFLRGKRQQAEKKAEGPPQKTDAKVAPLRTAERLAKEYDVSPRTIMNDATFADAVDKIEEVQGPEARAEILLGKSKLGKAAVVKAAKLPKAQMATALKTGKLPAAPKSGEQKKDPRLWGEIEGLLGKALNRTDELNKNYCHGNMHRRLIAEIKVAMKTLAEWKQAMRP